MRNFIKGLGLGLLVVSCASREYPVYVLRYREGRLNGKDAARDLPISVCDDTAQSKANCYVMLKPDYVKLQNDMIEYRRRLESCERGQ